MTRIVGTPFIDVVAHSFACTQFQGCDTQDARTRAAIQHALVR